VINREIDLNDHLSQCSPASLVIDGVFDQSAHCNSSVGEQVIPIRLCFPFFTDCFDWDMSNPDNQPETFASALVRDLELEPAIDYSIAIAYEIRKQVQIHVCQRMQGFCNLWESYVQQRAEEVAAAMSILDTDDHDMINDELSMANSQ